MRTRLLNFEIIEEPTPTLYPQYEKLRLSYKDNDNIPINMIYETIKYFFTEESKIIHYYSHTILLLNVKIGRLLEVPIVNWCQNREPDLIRIPDIASYIYNKRKPIDTIMYLSFNNKKQNFNVIDGIHRFSALKYIKEQNNRPLDLLDTQEYGSNGDALWFYNTEIIVNIRFNACIGDLVDLRDSLNQSQPMPTVLLNDNNAEQQSRNIVLHSIADEWQKKYKKIFSSSNDSTYLQSIGSTNRNKFIELLGILYDKYNIDISRIQLLRNILEEANQKMEQLYTDKKIGSLKAREKCKVTGCYLFLYKIDKLEDII
jgi:hypothetical protein